MVFLVEKYLTWILAGYVALSNLLLQASLFGKYDFLHLLYSFPIKAIAKNLHKPRNTTGGNYYGIMIIFISQYINTAIIVLLAYNSFGFPAEKIAENN